MKSVLISIRPEWVEKIVNGEKTIEVRKTAPQEVPFKAYIYCTKDKPYLYRIDDDNNFELTNTLRPKTYEYVKDYNEQNGKVIGEFICDKIEDFYCASVPYLKENNLGYGQFVDNGVYKVNGWHEGIVFERNDRYIETMLNNDDLKEMCLSAQELFDYIGVGKHLYAWHISDLKIYDKPRELSEFYTIDESGSDCCVACVYHETPLDEMPCRTCTSERRYLYRPPQSWQYVEELGE
jgi:predicted transcriptional regulator